MSKDVEYIFYSSNLICFYNHIEIIKHLKISLNKCHFYSPRKLIDKSKLLEKHNIIGAEELCNLKFNEKKIVESYNCLKKNKNFLKKTIGMPFIIFLPHLINFREISIIHNHLCVGYYFVEEGLPAYRKDFGPFNSKTIPVAVSFLNLILNKNWIPTRIKALEMNKKYLGCFGNFEYSFTHLRNRRLLKTRFKNEQCDKTIIPDGSHIFIFDQILVLNCSVEIYFKCIRNSLEKIKKNDISIVYIKYHPDLINNSIVRSRFNELCTLIEIDVITLNNDFFIEGFLSQRPNVFIYGLKSAVLLYAVMYGVRVICFSKTYRKLNENDSRIYSIENFFRDKKEFVNLSFSEPNLN